MELHNEFTVSGQPDEVFELLLDLQQVATCMPGATLSGRDRDEYRGTLKLKLGRGAAAYEGSVVLAEVDRAARAATLKASGRELDGEGVGEATIRATVEGNGTRSRVAVASDLRVSGTAAQVGRAVLGDMAQRLMEQLAANLETRLVAGAAPTAAAPAAAAAGAPLGLDRQSAESVAEALDEPAVATVSMLRKALPALAVLLVGLIVGLLVRARSR